jgi:hypothetical protein
VPRIADMIDGWKREECDDIELTRRLVDLFFVSVLLDAGAGDNWRWIEPGTDRTYERSEGIAVASLCMFKKLDFAAKKDGKTPLVDGRYSSISTPVCFCADSIGSQGKVWNSSRLTHLRRGFKSQKVTRC